MANNDCFATWLLKLRIRGSLIFAILLGINSITINSLAAQPVQSVPQIPPTPLPQDIVPPSQPTPPQIQKPEPLPPLEQLLPPPESTPPSPVPTKKMFRKA